MVSELARAARDDKILDLVQTVPARPGDCHCLPSGTIHALGAGVLVAEVQTPSDTTFRVYDWAGEYGRTGRPLHIDQALESIDFGPPPPCTRLASDESTTRLAHTRFFDLWEMPIFFLLSGVGSWYSLKSRTGGRYLFERVKRLLIPLYTVGLFILVAPQAYFDGVTHGRITGDFWQWLPNYYLSIPGDIIHTHQFLDPISLVPYTFSGHLWISNSPR